MRKILLLLIGAVLVTTACLKEDSPEVPIDPVIKGVFGKWALKDIISPVSASASGSLHANPYSDTLIYDNDFHFFIINKQDTADRGEYSLGQSEAINGYGRMQRYDSILYHSYSLVSDAQYRPVVYIKLNIDTLVISTEFLKDSAAPKVFARYIRQ